MEINKKTRAPLSEHYNSYPEPQNRDALNIHHPSYSITEKDYIKFLPLFSRIEAGLKSGNVILAIDGGSASGKSTLAELLLQLYPSLVYHMDDFFLRPEQRTAERYSEVGGNVDRERFLSEVLIPSSRGEGVFYRRFDCSSMKLCEPKVIAPRRLTVIEGVYSMHPELSRYYNLSVFLSISDTLQRKRIEKRNTPELAERFFNEWIPLERVYFQKMNVKERCDITVTVE